MYYTASGIITPIGLKIPGAVKYNFDLLMMSTCTRNMYRHEINLLKTNFVYQVG